MAAQNQHAPAESKVITADTAIDSYIDAFTSNGKVVVRQNSTVNSRNEGYEALRVGLGRGLRIMIADTTHDALSYVANVVQVIRNLYPISSVAAYGTFFRITTRENRSGFVVVSETTFDLRLPKSATPEDTNTIEQTFASWIPILSPSNS